ncbi:hypothetical protein QBC37DRAFT_450723 [Rhypophila decipiens]|uniref:DUF6594 domain-containing protein n=1 Tax=Rhypophila decipiens TaxID=261697 RepID=A0AAN6XYY4_9PEZI|nr:hypothetical protein QBC37DRAFT_450723 [Rhypophila decipiens]
MAAHDSLLVTRRFSHLRTRLLLLEQDRVAELEEKLNKIDRDETRKLFLGNRRRDKNEERLSVLEDLRGALKSYDDLVERSFRMLLPQPAHPKDVENLQNWHEANGSIARSEIAFLERQDDLMSPLSLSSGPEALPAWVERRVTEKLLACLGVSTRHQPLFKTTPSLLRKSSVSKDPLVRIYSRQSTALLTRAIITSMVIILVLLPMIICYRVEEQDARLAIVVTSTALFLFALSLATGKDRMLELVVAGATYTTVLVVFITGPGGGPS